MPAKGFPKGNCPASERKPRSSAQKRLDRTKENHTLPKGSVNHGQAATGQRMSHWGDMCEELRRYLLYRLGLAGGISTSSDEAHQNRKVKEWVTDCATHIFPSKNWNSRTLKKRQQILSVKNGPNRTISWIKNRFGHKSIFRPRQAFRPSAQATMFQPRSFVGI